MREILPYVMISLMPLFAIRCALVKGTLHLTRFVPCILVCLPLLAAYQGYELWNWHRTGERFVTTSAQTNAIWSLLRAAKDGPDIFSGDSPLDRRARPLLKRYDYLEAADINAALYKDGYRAPDVSRMAMDKYFLTWRQHPIAMLNLIRVTTSENLLKLAFRPMSSVCQLFEWAEKPLCFDYRDLYRKLFRHPSEMTLREISAFVAVTIKMRCRSHSVRCSSSGFRLS